MAINGLASASSYTLNFTPIRISVIFIFVFVFLVQISSATNPNGESYDYVNSRQFRKNLAVSRYRNNTYWLPEYQWTPPKLSMEPRRRPKWEETSDDDSDENNRKKVEKSEWEKKMEEITREEREKWKKYRTERSESSSLSQDNDKRLSRNFDDQNENGLIGKQSGSIDDSRSRIQSRSDIPETRRTASVSKTVERDEKDVTGSEDRFKTFEGISNNNDNISNNNDNNNNNNNNNNKIVDKNVSKVENPPMLTFSEKVEKDEEEEKGGGRRSAKPEGGKNSFEGSTNLKVKRIDDVEINSSAKKNNESSKKLTRDKSDSKTKSNGSSKGVERGGVDVTRRNLRIGENKGGGGGDKNFGGKLSEEKQISPEDMLKGRWGMTGVEPADKFLDDISRSDNIIEGIEGIKYGDEDEDGEDGEVEENGEEEKEKEKEKEKEQRKQSSGLKKLDGRKNLILKSKNEFWIKDDGRDIEDGLKNKRWLSEVFTKRDKYNKSHGFLYPTNNAKLTKTDRRSDASAGASKLIKIIIAPYVAATADRMELSIDRLIPETSGVSRMMESPPIVIGLSTTTLCDNKRRSNKI